MLCMLLKLSVNYSVSNVVTVTPSTALAHDHIHKCHLVSACLTLGQQPVHCTECSLLQGVPHQSLLHLGQGMAGGQNLFGPERDVTHWGYFSWVVWVHTCHTMHHKCVTGQCAGLVKAAHIHLARKGNAKGLSAEYAYVMKLEQTCRIKVHQVHTTLSDSTVNDVRKVQFHTHFCKSHQ